MQIYQNIVDSLTLPSEGRGVLRTIDASPGVGIGARLLVRLLRGFQGPRYTRGPLASGQAVRRLTLDQETEGSNPSSPAKSHKIRPQPNGRAQHLVAWPAPTPRQLGADEMVWAPDSTDLRAADSGHPDLWASDSRGQLTLGRAVELFLAAKAAEGASPRG